MPSSSTYLFTESNYKRYGLQPKLDHDDDPPHAVSDRYEPIIARSSSFHSPSTSPISRSRHPSESFPQTWPQSALELPQIPFFILIFAFQMECMGLLAKLEVAIVSASAAQGKVMVSHETSDRVSVAIGLLGSFFLVNWILLTCLQDEAVHPITELSRNSSPDSVSVSVQGKWKKN